MKLLGYKSKGTKGGKKGYLTGDNSLLLFKDVDNKIYIKDGEHEEEVVMQYGVIPEAKTLPYFYYKGELYEATSFKWLGNNQSYR